jgi:hypothetical protein
MFLREVYNVYVFLALHGMPEHSDVLVTAQTIQTLKKFTTTTVLLNVSANMVTLGTQQQTSVFPILFKIHVHPDSFGIQP